MEMELSKQVSGTVAVLPDFLLFLRFFLLPLLPDFLPRLPFPFPFLLFLASGSASRTSRREETSSSPTARVVRQTRRTRPRMMREILLILVRVVPSDDGNESRDNSVLPM